MCLTILKQKIEEDHYPLYLVDPGWINPESRNVEIIIQLDGGFETRNALSGEVYNISNNRFNAVVDAGLFSIIDVKQRD